LNRYIQIPLKVTALTPVIHFDDKTGGIIRTFKREHILYDGDTEQVPVYSGNAFRGILRRQAMYDYLKHLDITDEKIIDKLYYMLFSGGALTSGARYNEVGERRRMQQLCPPLALLGCAIGSQIPEGKAKGFRLKTVCKENEEFTGVPSEISCWDLVKIDFQTRRDDLKSGQADLISDEKKDREKDQAVQMFYKFETLITGAKLVGKIYILFPTEIEMSCLAATLERFKEVPYIGGMSSKGFGEIKLEYEPFADPEVYYSYLAEHNDECRAWVREIEKAL